MKLLDSLMRWLGWKAEVAQDDDNLIRVERLEMTVRVFEERLRKAGML